jgi:hypothetical protein
LDLPTSQARLHLRVPPIPGMTLEVDLGLAELRGLGGG